jgi:hypothetical protein
LPGAFAPPAQRAGLPRPVHPNVAIAA